MKTELLTLALVFLSIAALAAYAILLGETVLLVGICLWLSLCAIVGLISTSKKKDQL